MIVSVITVEHGRRPTPPTGQPTGRKKEQPKIVAQMAEELWVITPPLATGIHYALGPNVYGVTTLMRDACCYYAPTYYRAANAILY